MLVEGVKPSIELDFPSQPVVTSDQPAIIVEQHLLCDPAEVMEGALNTSKPTFLALITKRPDVEPPRIAQRRHKQVHLHVLVADHCSALAEVDLQLLAGRCLKADRCSCFRFQFAPQMTHPAANKGHRRGFLLRRYRTIRPLH
jgi:hypothetical protein